MDNFILGAVSIVTILVINTLSFKVKNKKIMKGGDITYNKECVIKCESIPIQRCPYEACMGNCKKTNCVSRCSNRKEKPLIICENQCKDLKSFGTIC